MRQGGHIVEIAKAQRLVAIGLHMRAARLQELGISLVQRKRYALRRQRPRRMCPADVIPVTVRGQDPAHILE